MSCFTVINKTALETDVSAQCDIFGVSACLFFKYNYIKEIFDYLL